MYSLVSSYLNSTIRQIPNVIKHIVVAESRIGRIANLALGIALCIVAKPFVGRLLYGSELDVCAIRKDIFEGATAEGIGSSEHPFQKACEKLKNHKVPDFALWERLIVNFVLHKEADADSIKTLLESAPQEINLYSLVPTLLMFRRIPNIEVKEFDNLVLDMRAEQANKIIETVESAMLGRATRGTHKDLIKKTALDLIKAKQQNEKVTPADLKDKVDARIDSEIKALLSFQSMISPHKNEKIAERLATLNVIKKDIAVYRESLKDQTSDMASAVVLDSICEELNATHKNHSKTVRLLYSATNLTKLIQNESVKLDILFQIYRDYQKNDLKEAHNFWGTDLMNAFLKPSSINVINALATGINQSSFEVDQVDYALASLMNAFKENIKEYFEEDSEKTLSTLNLILKTSTKKNSDLKGTVVADYVSSMIAYFKAIPENHQAIFRVLDVICKYGKVLEEEQKKKFYDLAKDIVEKHKDKRNERHMCMLVANAFAKTELDISPFHARALELASKMPDHTEQTPLKGLSSSSSKTTEPTKFDVLKGLYCQFDSNGDEAKAAEALQLMQKITYEGPKVLHHKFYDLCTLARIHQGDLEDGHERYGKFKISEEPRHLPKTDEASKEKAKEFLRAALKVATEEMKDETMTNQSHLYLRAVKTAVDVNYGEEIAFPFTKGNHPAADQAKAYSQLLLFGNPLLIKANLMMKLISQIDEIPFTHHQLNHLYQIVEKLSSLEKQDKVSEEIKNEAKRVKELLLAKAEQLIESVKDDKGHFELLVEFTKQCFQAKFINDKAYKALVSYFNEDASRENNLKTLSDFKNSFFKIIGVLEEKDQIKTLKVLATVMPPQASATVKASVHYRITCLVNKMEEVKEHLGLALQELRAAPLDQDKKTIANDLLTFQIEHGIYEGTEELKAMVDECTKVLNRRAAITKAVVAVAFWGIARLYDARSVLFG